MVKTFERPSFNSGEHKRQFDKVYICGMAPTVAQVPPDADEYAEIWKINEAYRLDNYYDRPIVATRWFQLHQRWDFTRRQNRSSMMTNIKDHWEWLRQEHDFPVYMQQVWDDIPSSVEFPLDDINGTGTPPNAFGTSRTNSPSFSSRPFISSRTATGFSRCSSV